MATLLEKRLIALSHLGIRIEHENGHRYIMSTETDYFNFEEELEKQDTYLSKVYGGINEALDKVDVILKGTKKESLEAVYNGLVKNYAKGEVEDYLITCDSKEEWGF